MELERAIDSLEQIVDQKWNKVIVDAGCGGLVSVKVGLGQLLILSDERMPAIEYSTNHPEGGLVVPVKENVGELSLKLQDSVDVVLCVAPDPRDVVKIAEDSETMLKNNGLMVIVLDLYSNKKNYVPEAINVLRARYKGSEDYRFKVGEGNPNQLARQVTGLNIHLQSRLKLDQAKVVVIQRKS